VAKAAGIVDAELRLALKHPAKRLARLPMTSERLRYLTGQHS
jgi:hypothetical protein